MIIIGEKLNSSIPKTLEAMKSADMEYLKQLIHAQADCGADYLDINTSLCGDQQSEVMGQLLKMVQAESTCGIMLDSPSTKLMEQVIDQIEDRRLILNSLTLTQRFDELLPLVKQYHCGVVGLPLDNQGIPKTVEKRVDNSIRLIEKLAENGVPLDQIFLDVLCEAIAVEDGAAMVTLKTIAGIKSRYPGVKTTLGLSNVSFGLPKRQNINIAFLAAAICYGLDSAIMDCTNPAIRTTLYAAQAITGQDEYCMDYIRANR